MGDGNGVSRVIGGCFKYDTQNSVIVGFSIFKSLDNNCADPVSSAISVSVIVVGLAVPCLRKELATTQPSKNVGIGHNVQATGNSSVAITSPKRCACQLNCGHA